MNYTYQTISESFSFWNPEGSDVRHASNRNTIKWALDDFVARHEQVGADPSMAQVLVWKGHLNDVQDVYPDFIYRKGPRGGYIIEPA